MLALVLTTVIGFAASPLTGASPPPNTAVIVRSASTNLAGSTILVTRGGTALIRSEAASRSITLDKTLTTRLYADLDRAGRLGDLPAGHCMKSASFGTTTVIAYGGQISPDLQCAQNDIERQLRADVTAISQLAGVDPGRFRGGVTL